MSPRVIDRFELIRSLSRMDDAPFRKVAEVEGTRRDDVLAALGR